MKRRVRLTESDLHRIVKESVNRALNEVSLDTLYGAYDRASSDKTNYGMLGIYGNTNFAKDGWKPNTGFDKAIGLDSKKNFAKRMQDRRQAQMGNFGAEIKRREKYLQSLPYTYQADFENAIDCLYYGEGKAGWLESAKQRMSKEDANNLWKIAVQFMSQDEESDWKRWLRRDWISGNALNSLNKGIDFHDF